MRFFDRYIRLLDYTFRSFYGNSSRKQEEAIHIVPLPDANESDVDESSDEELYICDIDGIESETEEEVIESDVSSDSKKNRKTTAQMEIKPKNGKQIQTTILNGKITNVAFGKYLTHTFLTMRNLNLFRVFLRQDYPHL